jgi:hypothetical protein
MDDEEKSSRASYAALRAWTDPRALVIVNTDRLQAVHGAKLPWEGDVPIPPPRQDKMVRRAVCRFLKIQENDAPWYKGMLLKAGGNRGRAKVGFALFCHTPDAVSQVASQLINAGLTVDKFNPPMVDVACDPWPWSEQDSAPQLAALPA